MASTFYGVTATNYNIRPTGLTSSSTLRVGYQSAAVESSADSNPLDYHISGMITLGAATVTDASVEIHAFAAITDVPDYPPPLGAAAASATFLDDPQKRAALTLLKVLEGTVTSSLSMGFGPIGLAQFFGGFVPRRHGIFITHNTGAALSATTASCFIYRQPIFATSTP